MTGRRPKAGAALTAACAADRHRCSLPRPDASCTGAPPARPAPGEDVHPEKRWDGYTEGLVRRFTRDAAAPFPKFGCTLIPWSWKSGCMRGWWAWRRNVLAYAPQTTTAS